MESAGVDIRTFKPNSIRGAFASAALKSGVSLSNIKSLDNVPHRIISGDFISETLKTTMILSFFIKSPLNCD